MNDRCSGIQVLQGTSEPESAGSLLLAAATSPLYRPWLERDSALFSSELPDAIREVHNRIARAGGTHKQQCFSLDNITQASHFANQYRGITSGRSGHVCEYRKGRQWVHQRDQWRRSQLQLRAAGDYAVINVASRLFPQDRFDLTLGCVELYGGVADCQQEILAHLREQGLHIFWRGYPARLLEQAQAIRSLCKRLDLRRTSVISTGIPASGEQLGRLQDLLAPAGVINEYGAQDCGLQLYACTACGSFHRANPRCLLSVEQGQLFATDLHSHSQPVLAMAIGDLAVVQGAPCPLAGEPGFLPRGIPAMQSPDQAALHRQRREAAAQHRPFILTAVGCDPSLAALTRTAGLQPQAVFDPVPALAECDVLVGLARGGAIGLCRERLGQRLSPALLASFARRHSSLIAYLIGQLVLVDLATWREIVWIWLEADGGSRGQDETPLARLARNLQLVVSRADQTPDDLLVIYRHTTALLQALLLEATLAEQIIGQLGLSTEVDPLLQRLTELDPADRQRALPIVSCCSDLLQAHCWRKDRRLLEWLAAGCRGSENGGIRAAEALHRAGLLRKL